MAHFSISEAAFAGFRIVRERPSAVLVWAIVALVISLGFTSLFISMVGPALMQLQAMAARGLDARTAFAAVRALAPSYVLLIVLLIAFYAFLFAAMNRAVMAPDDDAFGYLRFSDDELRQFAVLAQAFLLSLGLYVALSFVGGLVAALLIAASGGRIAPAPIVLGVFLLILAPLVVLAVRLSLAPSLTYATGRVNLFGSWRLTRGRFWPILGAYLLAALCALVVQGLALMIMVAVVAVIAPGDPWALLARADMRSIGAYFTTPRLVQTVLGAGVAALIWPVLGAPAPTIYAALRDSEAEPPATRA